MFNLGARLVVKFHQHVVQYTHMGVLSMISNILPWCDDGYLFYWLVGLCYRVVGLVDSRLGVPQPCHAITRASVSHFKGEYISDVWSYKIPVHFECPSSIQRVLRNISNTRDSVSSDIQTPRRELKIRRAAEYFWQNSRCLEMWWNTVSDVWYIFSIESKPKEKTEKIKSLMQVFDDFLCYNLMNY